MKNKEKTGIKTLKVGYNKVFGYYIEVSTSFVSQVPDRFIRKQTLTNGERYICSYSFISSYLKETIGANSFLLHRINDREFIVESGC
mgnify:CR=1 FL=1